VVILDPLYLSLLERGGGRSATNLFDMGRVLHDASDACLKAGATPIFVHHTGKVAGARKAQKGEALDLDDLAFAGIAEFARQWLLISRRRAYRLGSGEHQLWLSVGGSAGQSGLWGVDVVEGVLGEDFSSRRWDVTVRRSEDLPRQAGGEAATRQEQQQARVEETRRKILEYLAGKPEGDTRSGIIKATGCSKTLSKDLFTDLADKRSIVATRVPKRAGNRVKDYDGWKLAPEEEQPPGDSPEDDDDDPGEENPGSETVPVTEGDDTDLPDEGEEE
jgi:replicative DNA helicase